MFGDKDLVLYRHGHFLAGKATTVQCQPHQRHASVAATAATFYFAKSRQGLGLGGLASRGDPESLLVADKDIPGY